MRKIEALQASVVGGVRRIAWLHPISEFQTGLPLRKEGRELAERSHSNVRLAPPFSGGVTCQDSGGVITMKDLSAERRR